MYLNYCCKVTVLKYSYLKLCFSPVFHQPNQGLDFCWNSRDEINLERSKGSRVMFSCKRRRRLHFFIYVCSRFYIKGKNITTTKSIIATCCHCNFKLVVNKSWTLITWLFHIFLFSLVSKDKNHISLKNIYYIHY